jgi:peptidoglycan/LPS O-acetylase OafA/YrhL
MKNKYNFLAVCNILLSVVAICLYLPYTLEAFDMAGFEWFKFVPKILKGNYDNILIYFGLFLLAWFIVLNLITIFNYVNMPKFLCKITVVLSLALPLAYMLALTHDWALEYWIKLIIPNIKMIAYIVLCVSGGNIVLALMYNFTSKNRANFHHLTESMVMCALLTLMIICFGWCGWKIDNVVKIYGIMIGLLAIYLPISAIVLFICRKNRE